LTHLTCRLNQQSTSIVTSRNMVSELKTGIECVPRHSKHSSTKELAKF